MYVRFFSSINFISFDQMSYSYIYFVMQGVPELSDKSKWSDSINYNNHKN